MEMEPQRKNATQVGKKEWSLWRQAVETQASARHLLQSLAISSGLGAPIIVVSVQLDERAT
jgi:hypothetical protein